MDVNSIVTLDDNKKYYVLLENEYVEGNYYLVVELDDKGEYTKNYSIFQSISENGEEYVEEVDSPDILSKLIIDYELQYKDLTDDIKSEVKLNNEEKNDNQI